MAEKTEMIRVKPHPVCPRCRVVMKLNGKPAWTPTAAYYKCPIDGCGHTCSQADVYAPLSSILDARSPE